MYAITPRGIGKIVGARAIRADWSLEPGETFTVESYDPVLVLAENEISLREKTQSEINAELAEEARIQEINNAVSSDTVVNQLKAMTNVEFDAWWDANVTNAAQAINVLKRLARIIIRRVL